MGSRSEYPVRGDSRRAAGAAALAAVVLAPVGVPPASAAGLGGPAVVADAADMANALLRFRGIATLPDSLGLRLPVMLHGVLRDADGSPLSGAQVLLATWPSNEAVRALPTGGRFAVTPVARAVTDATGRFELRSAVTPLLARLAGKDGLDLELNVFHGGRHLVHLTQVVADHSAGAWMRQTPGKLPSVVRAAVAGAHNRLDVTFDTAAGARDRHGRVRPQEGDDHRRQRGRSEPGTGGDHLHP